MQDCPANVNVKTSNEAGPPAVKRTITSDAPEMKSNCDVTEKKSIKSAKKLLKSESLLTSNENNEETPGLEEIIENESDHENDAPPFSSGNTNKNNAASNKNILPTAKDDNDDVSLDLSDDEPAVGILPPPSMGKKVTGMDTGNVDENDDILEEIVEADEGEPAFTPQSKRSEESDDYDPLNENQVHNISGIGAPRAMSKNVTGATSHISNTGSDHEEEFDRSDSDEPMPFIRQKATS